MRTKAIFLAVSMVAAMPASAAPNLVTNGDFELGNTGFASQYMFQAPNGGAGQIGEGTYGVGTNANQYHNLWADVSAFEGVQYLVANGSAQPDAAVWQQTLTGLTVGSSYAFSAWATNVCCNAQFGGNNVTPIIIAVGTGGSPAQITTAQSGTVGTTGQWKQISGTFVAGATSTQLSIFTDATAPSGNDFGIDAISVTAVPEPATWAMMIGGFGLAGVASRRRQRANSVLA